MVLRNLIYVEGGRIASIAAPGRWREILRHSSFGKYGLACFADVHTHIDKGHIWPRKQNDGTRGLIPLARTVRRTGRDDVRSRMEFSRPAYAHGGRHRTHQTLPPRSTKFPGRSLPAWDAWQGRITLQGVCLEPIWGYADRARNRNRRYDG